MEEKGQKDEEEAEMMWLVGGGELEKMKGEGWRRKKGWREVQAEPYFQFFLRYHAVVVNPALICTERAVWNWSSW